MSTPIIHGKPKTISASSVLEAIANDLSQIKREDRLTYADLGRVLGKSEDQAAKYCDGTAEMSVSSYVFARREWNGRFTSSIDAMVDAARGKTCDRSKVTRVTKAVMALAEALEDDGEVDASEVRQNLETLQSAREAIDELIRRLA